MVMSPAAKSAAKVGAIILILVILGGAGYFAYEEYKKYSTKKGMQSLTQPAALGAANSGGSGSGSGNGGYPSQLNPQSMLPETGQYANQQTRYDLLSGGRKRSGKATGYSSDAGQACYNQNLVGSIQAPFDPKVGSSRCSFPSAPMGSKPSALGTSKLRGKGLAKQTRVDLSGYSRMSTDRAMGAQGLDMPEDLALASATLGHIEIAEPTRTDTWHPYGETPYSWRIGYSTNETGHITPGLGGEIPQYGPAVLAQRVRGVNY